MGVIVKAINTVASQMFVIADASDTVANRMDIMLKQLILLQMECA
jgi:hypothetical protein